MPTPILTVSDLSVSFRTATGTLTAVDKIDFTIPAGKTVALVGESGSGKSVTALSILGLLPQPAGFISSGSIRYRDRELTTLPDNEMPAIRGQEIGIIFQEPMTALNPIMRIGRQVAEALTCHFDLSKKTAAQQAIDLLASVGIPDAQQRALDYPHQLSGGMRQRVGIAIAIAANPSLLIADEPTTALDVTVQAQIIDLLIEKQKQNHCGILFITHNLSLVEKIADEIIVMYAGRIVEKAPTEELFRHPRHRYTIGLFDSIPKLTTQPKTKLHTIPGTVPSLADMPTGCRFAPRSGQPYTESELTTRPQLIEISPQHWVENSPSVLVT